MKGLSKGRYDETFAGEDALAEETDFSLFLPGTPKTGFVASRPMSSCPGKIQRWANVEKATKTQRNITHKRVKRSGVP